MDRPVTSVVVARGAKPSSAPAWRRVAAFGIVALAAGFVWLVAESPAIESLALALAAAIVWCVWLDSQGDACSGGAQDDPPGAR